MGESRDIMAFLLRIDRRIVYLAVALALGIPIAFGWTMPPAKMDTAQQFFDVTDELVVPEGDIVLIAMDWGPGTKAENEPQTEMTIHHLMRRRVKFAVISTYYLAAPFMTGIPQQVADELNAEHENTTGETWEYGKDWVNLGYKPGYVVMVQGLAKSANILEQLKVDDNGTPLTEIECMKDVRTITDIPAIAEFTGLVGAMNLWLQFFQIPEHRPVYLHGCTSITIPEAYIYLDSDQLAGLLEGVAGAAYYSKLVDTKYGQAKPEDAEPSSALVAMTSLSVAHFVIIFFIALGNTGILIQVLSRARRRISR